MAFNCISVFVHIRAVGEGLGKVDSVSTELFFMVGDRTVRQVPFSVYFYKLWVNIANLRNKVKNAAVFNFADNCNLFAQFTFAEIACCLLQEVLQMSKSLSAASSTHFPIVRITFKLVECDVHIVWFYVVDARILARVA